MSIEIKRSDKYVDYNISAENNRGYITIDTSDWINKPWMFYELPALKFEIYTETNGELVKYQNFTREIRTYNPVYSPLGVLNVTIDIRNVPEEFILRITPIFDNNAIAARNMLIENGIEDGDVWGSDQGVPTQLFNLDLEFIECEGEYVPPTPPVPPTHEETITGVPPITFDGSTGDSLVSWTILGNGSQTGAPTPDNPVMPEFVGVKTANLFDKSKQVESIYVTESATRYGVEIPVPAGTYTVSGGTSVSFAKTKIGDVYGEAISLNAARVFTLASDGYMLIYSSSQATYDAAKDGIMLNLGSTALPYEPFGWAEKITCAGQTTPVYLGQVSTVRRVKKLVLDGTENWEHYGSGAFWTTIATGNTIIHRIGLCNAYKLAATSGTIPAIMDNGEFTVLSSNGRLFIKNTSYKTAAVFKSYLAAQYANGTPVTVWYVLAEPTTGIVNEPLAKIGTYADELSSTDAGVTIPTTEGQNTLTVDTDLQPSEVTITYTKEGQ